MAIELKKIADLAIPWSKGLVLAVGTGALAGGLAAGKEYLIANPFPFASALAAAGVATGGVLLGYALRAPKDKK